MSIQFKPIVVGSLLTLAALTSCGSSGSNPVAGTLQSPSATSGVPATNSQLAGYQLLTPSAADALLRTPPAGLVIIDVRTPEEFAIAHLSGAIDVDVRAANFASTVATLNPALPYFVYCHSGNRSATAVSYLQQHGFTSLYELQGGIAAWQTAGLPTTSV